MTGDGNSNEHKRVMNEKGLATRWRSETILFNVDNVAHRTAHTTCLAWRMAHPQLPYHTRNVKMCKGQ
jgi:hypothetical protein